MGIVYPGAIDSFSVPSLPEETSLSAAGKNNNRNHTQLHDDINKAVVALETNAVLTSHDHSGTDSRTGGVKLIQGNTHEDADTDSSALAIHHTLGYGAYQAAPGNHTHSVATVSQNYQVCTSVSRPTPWLGMMIFETDTNQLTSQWGFLPHLAHPFRGHCRRTAGCGGGLSSPSRGQAEARRHRQLH